MNDPREALSHLLDSVSDRARVDWDAELAAAGPEERVRIESLRAVSRIASFSRGLQRGVEPFVPSVKRPHVAVPEAWGDLLVLEWLGSNAHADRFRAWDPALRRDVALELCPPAAAFTGGARTWIERMRAYARARHPHLVSVFGADERDGRTGMWMDLANGATLAALVSDHGPLGAAEAVRAASAVGAALAAVHAVGSVHGDVQPGGILRGAGNHYLLAPPRFTDAGRGPAESVPASQPPDVHGLGAVLCFALAGWPLQAEEIDSESPHEAPRWPSLLEIRPDLPAGLAQLADRAARAQAFTTAADFVAALTALDAPPPQTSSGGSIAAAIRRTLRPRGPRRQG